MCLSKGFYNVPCGLPLAPPLAFTEFKEVVETTVWSRGGVSESETIDYLQGKKGRFISLVRAFVCAQQDL
jgi:hypothetical protein